MIGRGEELLALSRAAANRVNVRLAAPRRYGKSTLIAAHADAMRAAGHRTVTVDLYRVATVADVAARVVQAYAALPRDPGQTLQSLVRRLGLSIGPAGVTLQAGPRGERSGLDIDTARAVLLETLDIPHRLGEADKTLTVVALDEFQDVLTADDRLDGLIRSVIQYHARTVAYIYAGSRTTLLERMFALHERPFFGQARPLDLPPLDPDETRSQLAATFAEHGFEPREALVDLVALGAGHPQRTMLLAHHLFDLLDAGESGPQLAAVALERALAETTDAHQAVWSALDNGERALVTALADGLAPTGSRTATQHAVPRTTLQRALARLLDDQQVVIDGPRLLDPLFAEWLRRR